jgi:hypothetical protein
MNVSDGKEVHDFSKDGEISAKLNKFLHLKHQSLKFWALMIVKLQQVALILVKRLGRWKDLRITANVNKSSA